MEQRRTTETASWYPRFLVLTLFATTAYSAVRPMISYRALELGASPFELGLVASANAVLALFAAIPIGRRVDAVGEPRFLFVGALLLAGSSVAMAFVGSLALLAACNAALGLAWVLMMVAGQTLIANRSNRTERQGRFGLYAAVSSIGQGIGPVTGGLIAQGRSDSLDTANAAPVLIAAAVPILIAAALAVGIPTTSKRTETRPVETPPDRGLIGNARRSLGILALPGMPQAMGASIAVILGIDLLLAYLPAHAVSQGIPVAEVGLLLSIRASFSLLSRLSLGYLVRRFGAARLLAGNLFIAAAGFAALPFADALLPASIIMAVIGFGLGTGQPMTIAMTANAAPDARRGESIGLRLTGNRTAQLLIPWIVGFVATYTGVGVVFVFLTASLSSAGAAFYRELLGRPR